jgi:hypothetical protein
LEGAYVSFVQETAERLMATDEQSRRYYWVALTDREIEGSPVRIGLAIRGLASCTLRVDQERWDVEKMVAIMKRYEAGRIDGIA